MEAAVRVVVHGTVQGVGFRAFARHTAVVHAIRGWVENKANGSVEIHAQGEKRALERFMAAIRDGPEWVSVLHAEAFPARLQDVQGFVIRKS